MTKVKYKWPRNIRNCNFSVVSSVNKKVGRYFRIMKKIRKHKKMSKKWTLPKEYVTRGKLQFLKRLWGAPEGARVHSLEQFHYLLYTSVLTHTHSFFLSLFSLFSWSDSTTTTGSSSNLKKTHCAVVSSPYLDQCDLNLHIFGSQMWTKSIILFWKYLHNKEIWKL